MLTYVCVILIEVEIFKICSSLGSAVLQDSIRTGFFLEGLDILFQSQQVSACALCEGPYENIQLIVATINYSVPYSLPVFLLNELGEVTRPNGQLILSPVIKHGDYN